MRHSRFIHFAGALTGAALLVAAGSSVVMWLWNFVMPDVCGFGFITFWQALGLLALGLTMSGGMLLLLAAVAHPLHPDHRSRHDLRKRWLSMSEAERREFFASRGFKSENDS